MDQIRAVDRSPFDTQGGDYQGAHPKQGAGGIAGDVCAVKVLGPGSVQHRLA